MTVDDLKARLRLLPTLPGIYRMLGAGGEVLYVGKARNLRNRVGSYFLKTVTSAKTRALVERIRDIETTVTASETEALLLEQTLIKELQPPYNILLRDDKSYPYIYLAEGEAYPRLGFYRGNRQPKGRYFGPYPSAQAVRESLGLLQKLFKVRQCEDAFFRNRERPCLQYQIKRCKAPCVGYVSEAEYAEDVRHTVMFLQGRNEEVMADLVATMEAAAERLAFEEAAVLRDQLAALRKVQEQQYVLRDGGQVDVVALVQRPGGVALAVLVVREGRVLGTKTYHPDVHGETEAGEILSEFLSRYYLRPEIGHDLPREIVLSHAIADAEVLAEAFRTLHGSGVVIKDSVRDVRAQWLNLAVLNAEQALVVWLASRTQLAQRFLALQEALGLERLPERLECFDISHSFGEATTASCVVFDPQGPRKSDYRRYNIEGITGGDDFAAMHQALRRRFARLAAGEGKVPDVLLIDGGRGQLAQAVAVLDELGVVLPCVVGVAKGEGRKPGLETLHRPDGEELQLPSDDPALHLIQHVRDEAHRFAITGHRERRGKTRRTSTLENIAGVGPKRRRQLIQHFGGLQEVMRASVKDLSMVPGISVRLAEEIYNALHSG